MRQTVPASVQLFLFADKLVSADSAFSAGTLIPYSQKKVKTNDLAAYLLAFTIWDMLGKNCIRLEIRKKKVMLLIPSASLEISLNKDIPVSGDLEAWLLEGVERNGQDLEKVIYKLLKQDMAWPHKEIINIVLDNTCSLGLGEIKAQASSAKALLKSFTGSTDFEPERVLIANLEPDFELLIQEWNQFSLELPKLNGMLITNCRSALNSRTAQND